ncbi:MAG: dTMP kinase [Nitrososphaeraceae archaeon]
MNRGNLIVFEGMDKAGKGTQCKLLQEFVNNQGKKSVIIEFPDYNSILGKEIKKFLHQKNRFPKEVQHILLSANRWEKKEELFSTLNSGVTIIMDRYYQSNLVYGISNGLDLNWLKNLDNGLPKEDMVIVLEINPNVSKERVKKNRDLFEENLELLTKVKKNYRELAKEFGWNIIDGERSIKEVHQEICKIYTTKTNNQNSFYH